MKYAVPSSTSPDPRVQAPPVETFQRGIEGGSGAVLGTIAAVLMVALVLTAWAHGFACGMTAGMR